MVLGSSIIPLLQEIRVAVQLSVALEAFKAISLLILVSGRRFAYLSFIIQLDLHIPWSSQDGA